MPWSSRRSETSHGYLPVRKLLIAVSTVIPLWGISAHADEIARLSTDLDGDGKPEIVILTVSGQGDFRGFTVQVGAQHYSGEYFAALGEHPQVKIVAIDWKRPLRQLMVTTPATASTCGYHLLAYANSRLTKLSFSQSEGCDEVPQPRGDGELDIGAWMGFWTRYDRYSLDASGLTLTPVRDDTYSVGVSVAAAHDLSLDPAGCSGHNLARGEYIRIETYEPARHRYLLKTTDGNCGWLAEDKVRDDLAEVPYAK